MGHPEACGLFCPLAVADTRAHKDVGKLERTDCSLALARSKDNGLQYSREDVLRMRALIVWARVLEQNYEDTTKHGPTSMAQN